MEEKLIEHIERNGLKEAKENLRILLSNNISIDFGEFVIAKIESETNYTWGRGKGIVFETLTDFVIDFKKIDRYIESFFELIKKNGQLVIYTSESYHDGSTNSKITFFKSDKNSYLEFLKGAKQL